MPQIQRISLKQKSSFRTGELTVVFRTWSTFLTCSARWNRAPLISVPVPSVHAILANGNDPCAADTRYGSDCNVCDDSTALNRLSNRIFSGSHGAGRSVFSDESKEDGRRLSLGERQIRIYLLYDGHPCPSFVSADLEVRCTVRTYLPLGLLRHATDGIDS